MRELVVATVIPPLEYVLHHILKVTPSARGLRLAPEFIKRLTRTGYVAPYGVVASAGRLVGKLGADVYHVVDAEVVSPVVNWRSDAVAELAYDPEHGGFPGAYVSPQEKPLVRIEVAVIVHDSPVEDVVVGALQLVPNLKPGADLPGARYEKVLVFVNPR